MQSKYLIGTLFEQEEQNKKMNIHNIKNKDPMGNTKWKGAFTGGFEAGFKNTCGSKEGWEPALFVSSVYKRAQKKQQTIHEFMDKQDLGRQSISANISLTNNFVSSQKNLLNISLQESIGGKILQKLKKKDAIKNLPENQEDLAQLMMIYEKEQNLQITQTKYQLKDLQKPWSVGARAYQVQQDQFIDGFQQLYNKIIRSDVKEQTQQEIQKRREQNKVYFDFSKPLEEQPQYLKQIQEIQLISQPKKRRKNLLNLLSLKAIFKQSQPFKQFQAQSSIKMIPDDFDPYHRIRKLTNQTIEKASLVQKQPQKHRIHSIQQRSDIFGTQKLSNKFVSASTLQNKFIRTEQTKIHQLKKFFQEQQKNKRYQDYVDQLEGRKITAQLQFKSFEQMQKEKKEFQAIYKLEEKNRKQALSKPKKFVDSLQLALQNKGKQICIKRQIQVWKPQKALCKRFGVLAPYKMQDEKSSKQNKNYLDN